MYMGQRGYVYVLSNPSMPGVVKIGRSENGGFSRAKAMYIGATGVPQPFHLEFELLSDDAHQLEESVHECLNRYRVNQSREFFRCSVSVAIESVIRNYISDF